MNTKNAEWQREYYLTHGQVPDAGAGDGLL